MTFSSKLPPIVFNFKIVTARYLVHSKPKNQGRKGQKTVKLEKSKRSIKTFALTRNTFYCITLSPRAIKND